MAESKKDAAFRGDVAKMMALKGEITEAQAGRMLALALDAITSFLASGSKVTLTRFGTFDVRKRAAGTARSPFTGGKIDYPARKVPHFTPGQALKNRVNGN